MISASQVTPIRHVKANFLSLLTAVVVLIGGCQTGDKDEGQVKDANGHVSHGEQPSVHGMLLVGNGPFYLSHLPMFHKPHDYQVILEVELKKSRTEPGEASSLYVDDRRVTGEKIYTIVPEPFVLTELFPADETTPRTSFKADLVRGHFERGGQVILKEVEFKITKVIYKKKLDPNGAPLPSLQYIVFGNDVELFGAHLIARKSDFDHVVSLRVTSGVQTPSQVEALHRGGLLSLASSHNDVAHALSVGSAVMGSLRTVGLDTEATVDVLESYYLETGDLSF